MTTLPSGRPLTAADLEAMPDDGRRYELIDGALVVTPSPSLRHQLVSSNLHLLLGRQCPEHLRVLAAPTDVRLAIDTVLQPDLLVVRRAELDVETEPLRPLLVVEILSPSTRHIDLELKRARYQAAGCPAYWVIDPYGLELRAWELRDGEYVAVAHVTASEVYAASQPIAVDVVPSALVR